MLMFFSDLPTILAFRAAVTATTSSIPVISGSTDALDAHPAHTVTDLLVFRQHMRSVKYPEPL